MRASFFIKISINLLIFFLFATIASAHPGSGIVINKNGEIFFTDTGQGVWKIDKQGKLTYLPSSRFHWLAIDEAGYFAKSEKSFGGWFERVTAQDSIPVLIMCSDFPLTINNDGKLYYADTRAGSSQIVMRNSDGKELVLARGDMFKDISGIVSAPDGSLYVTDASRSDFSVIRKITMDGRVSVFANIVVNKESTNNPPPETPTALCRGLAIDAQGIMYVAATGSRRVLRITSKGEVSTILQSPSQWSPTGVALFEGEVYVLEWRDVPPSQTEVRRAWVPRVRKVGLDGKVTTLATVER
ncbi:MAG: hypothetical protein NTX65_08250 [Ignavibacteriales bacterium]|nr:hypothetical protein [Ignavibacteriales bacterium]